MKSLPLKSKVVCISLQDSRLRNLSKKYDEEITDVWWCNKLYFIQALVTVDCGFQFGTTYGHWYYIKIINVLGKTFNIITFILHTMSFPNLKVKAEYYTVEPRLSESLLSEPSVIRTYRNPLG